MIRSYFNAVVCVGSLLVACFAWAESPVIQIGKASLLRSAMPATQGEISTIAAASGARRALLVWQISSHYLVGPSSQLEAVLIAEDGSRSKELLAACKDRNVREKPAIAHSAGRFLLVWQEFNKSQDWDVFGTIIDESGNVAYPCGLLIAGGVTNQALPTVAAAADGFLVLWQEAGSGEHYRLRTTRVDTKGKPKLPKDLIYSKNIEYVLTQYSPGWNAAASPYPRNASNRAYVMGGTAQIAYAGGNVHLLTWIDEYGWGPGAKGGYTRRFALLRLSGDDEPAVTQVLRSPAYSLGSSPGVLLIQDNVALFATGSILNRNGDEVAAAITLSIPSLQFKDNPNTERPGAKTWQSDEIIPLFYTPVTVAGRLAAFWNKDSWTVVAVGSRAAYTPLDRRLYVNFLDKNGNIAHSALEGEVLLDSVHPLGHVATFRSGETHWLAWSQESGDGLLTRLQMAPLSMH